MDNNVFEDTETYHQERAFPIKLPDEILDVSDNSSDLLKVVKNFDHCLFVYREIFSPDLIGIWLPLTEMKTLSSNCLCYIQKSTVVKKHIKIANPRIIGKKMLLSINSTLSDSAITELWGKYLPDKTRNNTALSLMKTWGPTLGKLNMERRVNSDTKVQIISKEEFAKKFHGKVNDETMNKVNGIENANVICLGTNGTQIIGYHVV